MLSSCAYTNYEKHETFSDYAARLNLTGNWKILATARSWNSYFGSVFWNPDQYSIVIAHRGTETKDFRNFFVDFYADVKGIVLNKYASQMNSACTLANIVVKTIKNINETKNINSHLCMTGHSLGGWLAQITTFTVKYLIKVDDKIGFQNNKDCKTGYHARTVVFDSPGCRSMLLRMADDFGVRHSDIDSLYVNSLDITSYLSAVNRVNTCGIHVGTIFQIDASDIIKDLYHQSSETDEDGFEHKANSCYISYVSNNVGKTVQYFVKNLSRDLNSYFTYTLKTHMKLKNILKVFDSKTGQLQLVNNNPRAVQVLDFPVSKIRSRGGEEYEMFFEHASPSNNFTPDNQDRAIVKEMKEDYSGYYPIRYQVKSVDLKKSNVNVFTECELLFLERYQQLRNLPNHLTPNIFAGFSHSREDITIVLKDFTIANKCISCESDEKLQEMIPYVKNLLHFYPDVCDKIEKALTSKSIQRQIIKSETANYYKKVEEYFDKLSDVDDLQNIFEDVMLLSTEDYIYVGLARICKAFQKLNQEERNENVKIAYLKENILILSLKKLLK